MAFDLFIRRVYTYKGISVAVDIDLVKKTVSLVEKQGDDFKRKKWYFSDRSLEYMQGWQNILDAMKYAVRQATKELEAQQERDEKAFTDLLLHLNDTLDSPKEEADE